MKNRKSRVFDFEAAFTAAIRDFARDMSGKQTGQSKFVDLKKVNVPLTQKDHSGTDNDPKQKL
jgi:hypothetical protein